MSSTAPYTDDWFSMRAKRPSSSSQTKLRRNEKRETTHKKQSSCPSFLSPSSKPISPNEIKHDAGDRVGQGHAERVGGAGDAQVACGVMTGQAGSRPLKNKGSGLKRKKRPPLLLSVLHTHTLSSPFFTTHTTLTDQVGHVQRHPAVPREKRGPRGRRRHRAVCALFFFADAKRPAAGPVVRALRTEAAWRGGRRRKKEKNFF